MDAVGESGIEMVDLQGIEDENERAKAMTRCIEDDRKKMLRIKEAEERADQREREKLQKSQEKSTKKVKKKMDPPKSQKVRAPLLQVPRMNLALMLQQILGEQNVIHPTSS